MTIETKYFTPLEACNTLPLVKKIVKDILDTSREMKLLADDFGVKDINNNPRLRKMADEINGFISELEEIGCFYKDWNFTIGLVDFPAVIDNREVMLCWKSDEDDIKFYHDIDSGYSGRKPIPEEYLNS
ncbi:MAG: hypothetical protein A2057_06245 [Ignavibacteria bacterium GWA2_35_9]|nr:MAG: hypothetical protein A2057_06245 [Ignavibacteria bacterium GWA2_35_9]OGU49591.1 MAG: hypothetical protein A2080_13880 [Ignavibacteria bacterium GWC2_36_12]OGU94327.1 MAG: hypothetical protein A2330_02275 [Ignavibacteria bacterium RIFOXYB2_FULL_36_7]